MHLVAFTCPVFDSFPYKWEETFCLANYKARCVQDWYIACMVEQVGQRSLSRKTAVCNMECLWLELLEPLLHMKLSGATRGFSNRKFVDFVGIPEKSPAIVVARIVKALLSNYRAKKLALWRVKSMIFCQVLSLLLQTTIILHYLTNS